EGILPEPRAEHHLRPDDRRVVLGPEESSDQGPSAEGLEEGAEDLADLAGPGVRSGPDLALGNAIGPHGSDGRRGLGEMEKVLVGSPGGLVGPERRPFGSLVEANQPPGIDDLRRSAEQQSIDEAERREVDPDAKSER